MRLDRVGADAENDDPQFLVGGIVVSEAAGLDSSTGCIVPGIEVQDDRASTEGAQLHRLARVRTQREIGRFRPDLWDSHLRTSPRQIVPIVNATDMIPLRPSASDPLGAGAAFIPSRGSGNPKDKPVGKTTWTLSKKTGFEKWPEKPKTDAEPR
jgi:hypothetical protein